MGDGPGATGPSPCPAADPPQAVGASLAALGGATALARAAVRALARPGGGTAHVRALRAEHPGEGRDLLGGSDPVQVERGERARGARSSVAVALHGAERAALRGE